LGPPRYCRHRLERRSGEKFDRPPGVVAGAFFVEPNGQVTEIIFYTFADNPLDVARRVAAKAHSQGKQVMIYAPDEPVADAIDRLLWTQPALGFVPHCRDADALAPETPVLIGANPDALRSAEVMINLSHAQPPAFARFERLVEIIDQTDEGRAHGRERYRFYQARGYALQSHDMRQPAG
jgi:DNA polymerase-3 subunit chi